MAVRTCSPLTFRGRKPYRGSEDEGEDEDEDGATPRWEGWRCARYGLSAMAVNSKEKTSGV